MPLKLRDCATGALRLLIRGNTVKKEYINPIGRIAKHQKISRFKKEVVNFFPISTITQTAGKHWLKWCLFFSPPIIIIYIRSQNLCCMTAKRGAWLSINFNSFANRTFLFISLPCWHSRQAQKMRSITSTGSLVAMIQFKELKCSLCLRSLTNNECKYIQEGSEELSS